MAFSSLYEEICPFTRDTNLIKSKLKNIDDYDKTCIETAFHGVGQMVLAEWGNNTACQVIMVTDGSTGIGAMSLKESMATVNQRGISGPAFPLPFPFPTKLHVVCIAGSYEPSLIKSKPLYQKLIDYSGNEGSIQVPENLLTESNVLTVFQKLAEETYTIFKGVLKCGSLETKIMLSPTPRAHTKTTDFSSQTYNISDVIRVCGFIPVPDIGSPMALSRHLILPVGTQVKQETSNEVGATDDNPVIDESTIPSFCVLLHGALKVENRAALVEVGQNWFGFVYSWADSKKKSNLMLTILTPGSDVIPWLGDLNDLGVADMHPPEQVVSFPIKPNEKRSYSQNGVVWIRQAGLQSDIQKILRHARKLPDKTQQFYKELNRLRKAAMSLGFSELLTGLAYIFEQECIQLPGTSHPDCALQLQHAADLLRKSQHRPSSFVLMPLQTNYSAPAN